MKPDLKKIYKGLFREKGIRIKEFEIIREKYQSVLLIRMFDDVHYYVNWHKDKNLLIYARFTSNTKQDEVEELLIYDPTATKLVDKISEDYKGFMKKRGFLKNFMSKLFQ